MSKRRSPFRLSQTMILTGKVIDDGQSGGGLQMARPDPFEDGEEDIVLPDGETVNVYGNDIILPSGGEAVPPFEEEEAYY